MNKSEITEEKKAEISQAEQLGFSKKYANEQIYPLHSHMIPEGIFYAVYPQSNFEIKLEKGAHEKNVQILEDGMIGAGGNRVRYNKKKKDQF